MKIIKLFFTTLLLFQVFISTGQTHDCLIDEFESTLNSQSSNSCTPNPNYSYSIDPAFLATFPEETIAVHFWAINRTDGTSDNPYTLTKLQESVDLLNS